MHAIHCNQTPAVRNRRKIYGPAGLVAASFTALALVSATAPIADAAPLPGR